MPHLPDCDNSVGTVLNFYLYSNSLDPKPDCPDSTVNSGNFSAPDHYFLIINFSFISSGISIFSKGPLKQLNFLAVLFPYTNDNILSIITDLKR